MNAFISVISHYGDDVSLVKEDGGSVSARVMIRPVGDKGGAEATVLGAAESAGWLLLAAPDTDLTGLSYILRDGRAFALMRWEPVYCGSEQLFIWGRLRSIAIPEG